MSAPPTVKVKCCILDSSMMEEFPQNRCLNALWKCTGNTIFKIFRLRRLGTAPGPLRPSIGRPVKADAPRREPPLYTSGIAEIANARLY